MREAAIGKGARSIWNQAQDAMVGVRRLRDRIKRDSLRLGFGYAMKPISCCLRFVVFPLPPAPGTKSD